MYGQIGIFPTTTTPRPTTTTSTTTTTTTTAEQRQRERESTRAREETSASSTPSSHNADSGNLHLISTHQLKLIILDCGICGFRNMFYIKLPHKF